MPSRRRAPLLALLLGALVVAHAPGAAAYPEKPVTMIVPFAAGGGVDLTARTMVELMKPHFPQPIAVVNRPGGGGSVGAAEVVLARPDGYTIGLTGGSLLIQPHLIPDLPFKGPADYQPVIKVVTVPTVLAVRSDAPWANARALLDDAKANPGKIRVGSAGRGTALGLPLEAFKAVSGANLRHVPFGGSSEVLTNLLGGHVEGASVTAAEALPHVRAGKAKVLLILEDKRISTYPDAPSVPDLGFKMAVSGIANYAIFAPKSTPEPALQTLHEAARKAMDTDAFRKYVQDYSYVAEYRTRADLRRDFERLDATAGDLARQLGLKK